MNYGEPPVEFRPPQSRPRSSGLGCLFFLIVAGLVFYVMSQNRAPVGNRPGPAPGPVVPAPGRVPAPQPLPTPVPTEPQSPKSTTQGDWSIEEVEAQPAGETTGGVILDVPGTAPSTIPPAPESKRTEQGDWSIEEVDGNQGAGVIVPPGSSDPAIPNAPKKTQEGDWEIEEVKK